MKIRLHLGAHRTGTTTLQTILRQNSEVMLSHGVRCLTCWGFGNRSDPGLRSVTRLVHQASKQSRLGGWSKRRDARRMLDLQIGAERQDVLVLSDENLLGKPISEGDGAGVYPNSRDSLQACARVLSNAPERVHVTVRDYASFLTSAYAMAAVYGSRKVPFVSVKERMLRVEHRWPQVLRDVCDAFPRSKVSFGVFEKAPIETTLEVLLAPEVKVNALDLAVPRQNSSPTVEAIAAAFERGPLEYEVADALILEHAGGTRFDPLSDHEKAELSDLYAEDLGVLRREFDEAVRT